jgi:hypothetical protein
VSKSSRSPVSSVARPPGAPRTAAANNALSRAPGRGPVELISFRDALEMSNGRGKRYLLLGNGFSIALFPKIFSYNTLLERARASGKLTPQLQAVFRTLKTTDFETAMETLEQAAQVIGLYTGSEKAPDLRADAALLRDVLAETIAENHPPRPHDVTPAKYASCRRFLTHFDGNIYTLNYDLLLYWTLMQTEIGPGVKSDDGFRHPDDWELPFVTWDVQKTGEQRIFYLHGALHIYDAGKDLLKFTWSKTEVPLIDQIKKSLAERKYPLIVTEGTSDQKMDRIQHSGFLNRGYRSFSQIPGSLFIYGHSLGDSDEHLLKLIDTGKTRMVFVGIYGDPATDANRKIIERARLFRDRRERGTPPEVHFFEARTAQVWDGPESGTATPRLRKACLPK